VTAHVRATLRPPLLLPESRLVYGQGAVERLGEELRFLEARRALILCGPNAACGATLPRARAALGPACAGVFDRVRPHSPTDVVEQVARRVQDDRIDALVTIGGGSTIDTAKGVAAMLGEDAPLEQLTSVFTPPDYYVERYLKRPKLPILAVVTTLSGSEITPTIACRDPHGTKLLLRGDHVAARVVVLDPQATQDTDLLAFAHSGMNGLAHGLEGLYSRSRQPLSDALALESIRLFATYLPLLMDQPEALDARSQQSPRSDALEVRRQPPARPDELDVGPQQTARPDDLDIRLQRPARLDDLDIRRQPPARPDELDIRLQLLFASVLGGLVVSNARVGIHHAVCHCLGARLALSHGLANALMLPHAMAFNLSHTAEHQARAAQAMGVDTRGLSDEDAARRGIDLLRDLQRRVRAPARLRDLPTPPTPAMLRQVAEDTLGDRGLYFNPRPVSTAEQVLELLEQAW
jgi:alcohol dehydrogenase